MTGVVAPLVPADDREVRGEEIDDLAFAFVAPLRAKHGDVHAGQNTLPTAVRFQGSGSEGIRLQV
jgi:hypothetical protein